MSEQKSKEKAPSKAPPSKNPAPKGPDKKAVQRAPAPAPGPAPQSPVMSEEPAFPLAGAGQLPRLPVGPVDDAHEREAQAMADKVVAGQKVPKVASAARGAAAQRAPAEAKPAAEPKKEPKKEPKPPAAPAPAAVQKLPAPAAKPSGEGNLEVVAARAIQSKGPGRPLEPAAKAALEKAFAAKLDHVKVHDDPPAREAAQKLSARAFTYGSDIWLGPGESQDDLRLLAHETTHVLQQEHIVRRDPTPPPTHTPAPATSAGSGSGSGSGAPAGNRRQQLQTLHGADAPRRNGYTVRFGWIDIPPFKLQAHRGAKYQAAAQARRLRHRKNFQRVNDQVDVWENALAPLVTPKVRDKIRQGRPTADLSATWRLQVPKDSSHEEIEGRIPDLARQLTRPSFGKGTGKSQEFHVDHIVELQLASENGWANALPNMELLNASDNTGSGKYIDSAINRKIDDFITTEMTLGTGDARRDQRTTVRESFDLDFDRAIGGISNRASVAEDGFWSANDISQGRQLDQVTVLGVATHPPGMAVGTSAAGPKMEMPLAGTALTAQQQNWLKPLQVQSTNLSLTPGASNSITVHIPGDHPTYQPLAPRTIPVQAVTGGTGAGVLQAQAIWDVLAQVQLKSLSPVTVERFEIRGDQGIYASGAILPTVPLFQRLGLQWELSRGDLRVSREISIGELSVPAPLRVTDSSVSLWISTGAGLGADGNIDFGIDRVGEGYLEASVSTGRGFAMSGGFNFDSTLFTRAAINMRYENNEFSGDGTLAIGPGKVPGIRAGTLAVRYERGRLTAEGTVTPDVRGIQEGAIRVEYSEAEGFLISGRLALAEGIPGIRGGQVDVTVRKQEEGWSFAARGTAEPAIPGVNASVTVDYANGALTIEGTGAFQRGMLSGEVQIGATNRVIDEQGRPTDQVADRISAYGGGTVTIRFTPWLQGSVGVRVRPSGSLIVSGEIGIPNAINFFEARVINRELFRSPNIDIPIVGVSVLGQRIGIFVTISGGLNAEASIGPGQLQELRLHVDYDQEHEDQTHVTGTARVNVPAQAGLRLWVRGGLGVGIPIVSASANLEIGGSLGLEGALNTGVDIDWMPGRGFRLDAFAEIFAQPKFRFDISAVALVEADLLFTTATLYNHRWNLASFEYGSDLRVGVRFPVHYEEGRPFNVALSDVEFIRPDISPMEIARGLVRRLTSSGPEEA